MIFLLTIILAVLSAIFYRAGGMSKAEAEEYVPWKWMPKWMICSKTRDIGCAFLGYLWMTVVFPGIVWWIHLISFALMFAALCTYWDDWFNGIDNFYMHGGMIALAYLMYQFSPADIGVGFTLRCIALSLSMGLLCDKASNVYVEECGRGSLIIWTLPLLLIKAI